MEPAGCPAIRQVKDILSDECYTDAYIRRSSNATEVHVSVPPFGFKVISLGGITQPLHKNMVDTAADGKDETKTMMRKICAANPEDLIRKVDNK